MEHPSFEHPISLTADEIWGMENTHQFPVDIESHYKGLLNMMDVLYYRNGNSFFPEVKTRHTAFFLALAMPSYAFIDPHRTREMKYNLHAAAIAIENDELTKLVEPYDSLQMRNLEVFVTLAMYKLVSEKSINDTRFHQMAEKILSRMQANSNSAQEVFAYDTIEGTYQVYPNAAALLAFQIHDRCFGTDYCGRIQDRLLSFLIKELFDHEHQLYRDFYKTGSLGVKGEPLNRAAAWSSKTPNPSANALAICFMNYFDRKTSFTAWESHKKLFTKKLLSITAEQLADTETSSYLSQLPPIAEALYTTLAAAKEMDDQVYFEKLQKHIMDISGVDQREGKIFFDALGQEQILHGDFLAFARVHVGWDKLMNHPWESFYDYDYNKVR